MGDLIEDTGGGSLRHSAIACLTVFESFFRDEGTFPPRNTTTGVQAISIFELMLEAAPCANLILVAVDEHPGWRQNALEVQRR